MPEAASAIRRFERDRDDDLETQINELADMSRLLLTAATTGNLLSSSPSDEQVDQLRFGLFNLADRTRELKEIFYRKAAQ